MGGTLLAPMALLPVAVPWSSSQVPDVGAPATPSTTIPVPSSPFAVADIESPGAVTTITKVTTTPSPAVPPTPAPAAPAQPPQQANPRDDAIGTVHTGSPCSSQGEVAQAYADSAPTVCAIAGDGTLRWRKA
ncbi:hypothetical protein FXN61_07895 [Lentzea sp. PSKA42]|uniref:Uncharacterized protein n=1 Tax=Lentzea indica TaxID=2604800 RepID=A0ABX1FDN8_9PSEU|nr:hypothetical protein [Lentzea indica]NKE56758.1 hypothetical protein [Lentzea indica]